MQNESRRVHVRIHGATPKMAAIPAVAAISRSPPDVTRVLLLLPALLQRVAETLPGSAGKKSEVIETMNRILCAGKSIAGTSGRSAPTENRAAGANAA